MNGQQMDINQAKQVVLQTVQESGVPPGTFVQLKQMAEQVLKNKQLYPQFVDAVIKTGMADPGELDPKFDYEALIGIIAMGVVCQEMAQPSAGAAWMNKP